MIMETSLELPVEYKGMELLLPMKLITSGYTWRFLVQVNGTEVWVEKDEQSELRVLAQPEHAEKANIPAALLEAIVESIRQII